MSIFLEALTLPSAPRRLVEPTPLPIGRQAYTMLARHRCVWCRGAAPVRDLAQITCRNRPGYCAHWLDLFPFRLSRRADKRVHSSLCLCQRLRRRRLLRTSNLKAVVVADSESSRSLGSGCATPAGPGDDPTGSRTSAPPLAAAALASGAR